MEFSLSERIRFTLKGRVTTTIKGREIRTDANVHIVSLQVIDEDVEGFPAR